ncbi:hypothetical protein [Miltoncostaea marina]|uniref:hypothetical protein n=1 Tax=Miltoncostaea marina TaxID=2843215 RepID=UPI001C3CF796|nr:hypothetical protein [Miltoncostaea marina]
MHASDASAMVAPARGGRRRCAQRRAVREDPLPAGCDAVAAIGEVLGYGDDVGAGDAALAALAGRAAARAAPRGPAAGRSGHPRPGARARGRRWAEGAGWAVPVEGGDEGRLLLRRIVAVRDPGDGRPRRGEEVHRQVLHPPARVLTALRRAGFAARTPPGGYTGGPLPPGVTARLARRRR